jgi:replication-associated recombination protein RarA
MKDNVKLLKENIQYRKLNKMRSTYDIFSVDDIHISRDKSDKNLSERYRPREVFDLNVSDDIASLIQGFIDKRHLPDLILYSIQGGTGKTSISQVLSNKLGFETLSIPCNINRGLDVIKKDVVGFSQNLSMMGDKKIVSLEEIGDMTTTAVDSLKSVIDNYNQNVHLVITTNSLSNISSPLMTRLSLVDFNNISEEANKVIALKSFKRLKAILDIEDVEYTMQDLQMYFKAYYPRFRTLMLKLETSIIDGKLVFQKSEDTTDYNEVLELINAGNTTAIQKLSSISEKVNQVDFTTWLSANYLNILNKPDDIAPLLMILNSMQEAINKNVPFLSISFMVMCNSFIKEGIKFRV